MAQSAKEKLDALEKREAKIKEQKRKLKLQISQKERKERTRRLIQIGAIVESITETEITDLEAFKKYVIKYKNQISRTQKDATENEQNKSNEDQ